MATNQFQSPVLAPDLLQKQFQLQNNQALAQSLMQSQAPQGQMVSGHFVAPSWTQQLAAALRPVVGQQIMQKMPEQMAEIQGAQQQRLLNMFGLGGQSTGAQAFPVSGQASPQALAQGLSGDGQSMMPLLPGRDALQSYQAFTMMGPQEYMKAVTQQGAPTDIQKNLIAQGIRPGSAQWQQALGATTEKAGYIAPISAAPGSTIIDPRTGRPTFNAPQDGRQVQFDAQGNPSVQQVPGWNEAEAAQARAQAAGSATGKVTGEHFGKQLTGEKRREAVRAASGIDASIAQLGRLKDTVNILVNHPGFEGISGLSLERMKSLIPGTDAANAAAQFTTLKSQVAQNVLQMYRQMSETGGAVGQVSNVEQELFQNNLGALDRAQSPEAMRESLGRIAKFVDESTARLKSAYDREYGAGTFNLIMGVETPSANTPNGIPRITDPSQLKSLPSGSLFIAPDGTTRRVP